MVRWPCLALLAVLAVLTAPAVAQHYPLFSGASHSTGVGYPAAIAVGDLNHDGLDDVVVSKSLANKMAVLLGQGNGHLGPATEIPGTYARLALADMNLDGHLDAVVADVNGGRTSIRPGNGLGGFGSALDVMMGDEPEAVVVADVDEDGLPDIATAHASGLIGVVRSTAPGVFAPAQFVDGGPSCSALTAADVDADGHVDLVVGNGTASTIAILLGDGTGDFSPPDFVFVGHWTISIAAADLNADGRPEVVSGGSTGAFPMVPIGSVAMSENDGSGGFLPPVLYDLGDYSAPRVLAGDTDADGDADIVAAAHPNLLVFAGGEPGPPVPLVAPEAFPLDGNTNLALADVDGDGSLDALYCHTSLGVVVAPGDGSGAFETMRTFDAGQPVAALAVGDIDADGRADVVAVPASGPALVRLGNGLGGFGAAAGPTLALGGGGSSVALGDVDLDGDDDLVVGIDSPFDGIWIFRSDGLGGFLAPAKKAASGSRQIDLADIDADGFLDIAGIGDDGDTLLSVLRNKGDGTFLAQVTYPIGFYMKWLTHGDLDADGYDDLVVVSDHSYAVLLADGRGELAPAVHHPAPLGYCTAGALGDVDEDGRLDLALAESFGDNATIALGDGAGGFGPATNWPTSYAPGEGVALVDLDGDGHLDLATSGGSWVRRGDGSGSFGALERYSTPSPLGAARLADIDGDGAPDGVGAWDNFYVRALTVSLNLTGAGHAPWDDLGHALAGTKGDPVLAPKGTLLPGSVGSLALSNAAPAAPVALFVAAKPNVVPFKGGALLAAPPLLTVLLLSDATGRIALPFTWPAGVPAAITLTFQFAVADGGAPNGVALSNGVRAITP